MGKWLVFLGTVVFGLVGLRGVAAAQERCPFAVSGEIATGDPTQTGRLKNGAASTCAKPKAVPDLQPPLQERRFDAYALRNRSTAAACVTVTLTPTSATALSSAAYLETFDKQNPQANYLGDSGGGGGAQTYSFNVPALASFVVTVTEVGNGGGTYDLTVGDCGSVVVTAVNPNAGPIAGGTSVTVTGSGFVAGATVTFGGVDALGVTVANDTTITATTPPGAPGPTAVVVTNPGGASSTLTDGFVYVAPTATALTVASSANPSIVGQNVTFTATATSAAGTPTGNIVFKDGTTTIGTVALSNTGSATFSTTMLAVGVHPITASYAGSATFEPATSAVVSQAVTTAKTSTSLAVDQNPTVVGNTVHFTVIVGAVAPATGTPTGTVTVSADGTPVGAAVALDANGRATITTSSLATGTHAMVATYSGDAKFASSVSGPLSMRVDARVEADAGGSSSSSGATSGSSSSGAAADAGMNAAPGDASGGGGCDCRTSGGSASSAGLFAFATLAVLGLSRRRRRS
jgi:MYXO-CTERM domain-containing protein